MTGTIAIDALIEPDEATRSYARALNQRLRQAMPEGFPLDDTHVPHITLLQRYVLAADLDEALDALGSAMAVPDLTEVRFRAARLGHGEWDAPGVGMLSLLLAKDARLTDLQETLRKAAGHLAEPEGAAAAFAADPGEPVVNATTVQYVASFVPEQTGPEYTPHLTVGMGRLADLAALEAAPFEPFDVSARALAVFQLGNNGTARRRLRTWLLDERA